MKEQSSTTWEVESQFTMKLTIKRGNHIVNAHVSRPTVAKGQARHWYIVSPNLIPKRKVVCSAGLSIDFTQKSAEQILLSEMRRQKNKMLTILSGFPSKAK